MGEPVLTDRQKKWFATVQANLEAQTGKPLAAWLEIMKSCPETRPRAQAAWLKANHGVGQNHAAHILDSFRGNDGPRWDDAQALRTALWKDPSSLAVLQAIETVAGRVDGVISGQRKGYTAFSRTFQFAAARPLKAGRALMGLKLPPDISPRLSPSARRESWSERLTAVIELEGPDAVDADLADLFAQAADRG